MSRGSGYLISVIRRPVVYVPTCEEMCAPHLCEILQTSSGFYRAPCFPGQGARCIECSNALPAAARYIEPGSPIHSDNCQWDCTGIYDRRGDVCVVGTIAVGTTAMAGSLLIVVCGISAGYHGLKRRQQSRAIADLHDQVSGHCHDSHEMLQI